MDQEYHNKRIDNVCRLCRKKIKSSNPKSISMYEEVIKVLFEHDLKNDINYVHPKNVCDDCRRKLDYCKGKIVQVQQIATFEPHSINCVLCHTKPGYRKHVFSTQVLSKEKSAVKKEEISLTLTQEIAFENGFTVVNDLNNSKIFMKPYFTVMVISVRIFKDFSWRVLVHDKQIPQKNFIYFSIPPILTCDSCRLLFSLLKQSTKCPGNNDFPELVNHKLSMGTDVSFFNKQKEVIARCETETFKSINDISTIRTINCSILISNSISMCSSCKKHRPALTTQSHRIRSLNEDIVKTFKPNTALTRKEMETKMNEIQKERKLLIKNKKKMEKRINSLLTADDSVLVDESTHNIIEEVVNKNSSSGFEESSPKNLLWEQQKKLSKLKKKSSMRYHPVFIRWCLSIYLRSPATYDHIRGSGFLDLPHRATLNKYTGFTSSGSGINADIVKLLLEEVKDCSSFEKETIILFDEMKIKEGVVYSKHTGKLIGFTELGDINDALDEFARRAKGGKEKQLASHVLCFMARGLFKHFNHPIGYFGGKGFDSYQLFAVVWEAVHALEMVGLKVRAMVSDGASPNRRFYKIHELSDGENKSSDGVVYWFWNRFAEDKRKIFLFSDVPHLMKTLRNNLENCHGHNNTRSLLFNNLEISWQHVVKLYEWDLGMNQKGTSNLCTTQPGIRMMPKITEDHISLSPRLRMRVYLAVQVLSSTVANAMEHRSLPYTKSTEKFIRLCDKFFDCLNVTNTFEGQKSLKDDLKPYRNVNDKRFEWLENEFLGFLNEWQEQIERMENVPKEYKKKMFLSHQTVEGIRITVHSFTEMVPLLLTLYPGKYFLSDKCNQDPLEEHFGRIRMRGGSNENPTLEEYGQRNRKAVLAKSEMLTVMRGNTRGRAKEKIEIDVNDTRQLPKRPKKE